MTEGEIQGVRKRALSATKAEEIKEVQNKVRKSQPDKPIHKPRDSLFSWTSGFDNFTGFVNWAFLLLSIGGLRLLLENFIKYGIRVDPIEWIYFLVQGESSDFPTLMLILYHIVPVVICLIIEKALSVEVVPTAVGMIAHVANLVSVIMLPMVMIHVKDGFSLIGASNVCTIYTVIFLKLWSYVQVNMWCRNSRQKNSKGSLRRQSVSLSNLQRAKDRSEEDLNGGLCQYPDNLSLRDLYYFLFAPTLCYELNFARTERIRKRFLLKRIFEVLVGTQIILAVIQQWMIPSIKNSLVPFSNMDYTLATERLLKLAIPNHLAWLIMFYILFHSWLNLFGELLQFADRDFYADWWNSSNIEVFWRTWNLPVHRWAVRHLYLPMIDIGYGRTCASVVVFFFSAFFHEYMVSVPLRTYKIWAFMGMMGQIPLSMISRFVEKRYGPRFGNIVVWSSIIIGQPLCIMMYYHDYMVIHHESAIKGFHS
ncbi:diacylglycerol O-acyltransferase 1 [Anthonomus grandis grandis]|uniref:diacylglycerol O-acyltransferase 1 n=1 Tax=Anthonomus grandis grandis TaxID=2921223 RepID=UPI00216598DC|nr:diacylglycerol O-acyltransferase 1 [Anthonomus grandis grandis]